MKVEVISGSLSEEQIAFEQAWMEAYNAGVDGLAGPDWTRNCFTDHATYTGHYGPLMPVRTSTGPAEIAARLGEVHCLMIFDRVDTKLNLYVEEGYLEQITELRVTIKGDGHPPAALMHANTIHKSLGMINPLATKAEIHCHDPSQKFFDHVLDVLMANAARAAATGTPEFDDAISDPGYCSSRSTSRCHSRLSSSVSGRSSSSGMSRSSSSNEGVEIVAQRYKLPRMPSHMS